MLVHEQVTSVATLLVTACSRGVERRRDVKKYESLTNPDKVPWSNIEDT